MPGYYIDTVNSVLEQIKNDAKRRWPTEDPTPYGLRKTIPKNTTNLGLGDAVPQPSEEMVDVPDYTTLSDTLQKVGVSPEAINILTKPSKNLVLDTAGLPVDWKTRIDNVADYNKVNDIIGNWGVTKKIARSVPPQLGVNLTGYAETPPHMAEVIKGGITTENPEWYRKPGGVNRGLIGEAIKYAVGHGDVGGVEKGTQAFEHLAKGEAELIAKPDTTPELKEYGVAKSQGFKGSFIDYKKALWKPDKPDKADKLNITDIKSAYNMDINNIKNQMMVDMTPNEQANLSGQPVENILALIMSGRIGRSLSPDRKKYYLDRLKQTENYYSGLTNQVLGRKGVKGVGVPPSVEPPNYEERMSNAKRALQKGASKESVRKRLRGLGYSDQQLNSSYFNWLK